MTYHINLLTAKYQDVTTTFPLRRSPRGDGVAQACYYNDWRRRSIAARAGSSCVRTRCDSKAITSPAWLRWRWEISR